MPLGAPVVLDPQEVSRRLGSYAGPEDIKRAFNIPDGNYVIGAQAPVPDAEVAASNAPDYSMRVAAEELASGIAGGPGGRGYMGAFQPPAGYEESRRGGAAGPTVMMPSADSPALSSALSSATASMLPPGQGVMAPPVGTGSVLRQETDYTDPGMAAPALPQAQAAQTAPATSPSIRAVRMPDGKIVFTNRPEYGGAGSSEISTAAAGEEIRNYDRDRPITPTRVAMGDMVRKSQERMARTSTPGSYSQNVDPSGGVTGRSEYVQENAANDKLEQLARLTGLARAQSDLEVAQRSPEEQQALGTKEIQIMEYMQRGAGPKIEQLRQQADEAIAAIPTLTKDPDLQARMRQKIEDKRNREIQSIMDILSIGSGIRPQPVY